MKVLHISLGTHQTAQQKALAGLGQYRMINWQDYKPSKLNKLILKNYHEFKPDLIFMQLQTADIVEKSTLKQLKTFTVNWTGDVRDGKDAKWYFDSAPYFSVTLFTNTKQVDDLRALNLKADYLQIGFQNEFYTKGHPSGDYPEIVFLGNNYGDRFPLSQQRREMVTMLRDRYGDRFGAYGSGFGPSLNPDQERDCYRSCKIAINQNHYDYPRFSSDRIHRILGSGAFCLSNNYSLIKKEFKPQFHLDVWDYFNDLCAKIDYYLGMGEPFRKIIAENGYKHIHKEHTWEARMKDLRELYNKYR